MAPQLFVSALVLGGAVLALWLDVRAASLRPATFERRMGHAFVAILVLNVGGAVAVRVLQSDGALLARALALFLVFLPGLVYAFLACVWLLRSLSEYAATARR